MSPTAAPEIAALATAYDSSVVDMNEIKRLWPKGEPLADKLTRDLRGNGKAQAAALEC